MTDSTTLNQVNADVPTHPVGDPKSFSAPLTFLTPAEIEDLAVRLAMSDIPLAEGLNTFARARETKVDALEEEYRLRKAILSGRIAELSKRIEDYRERLHEMRATQADLRNAKFKINVAIQSLHLGMATIRLEARVKQLEVEKQFFDDETRKLSEKEALIGQQIIQDKENELQDAKQLHSSLLEVWQVDEAELNRRAETLKEEQQNAEALLKPVEQKIKYLRGIGITRTTAGFLLWAGYTAFAGVGSLIGSLLQQRQKDPSEADLIGNFVRGFAGFFGLSQNAIFSWAPFLKMLSFVGATLLFLVAATVLCDLLLPRFNPRWRKSAFPNRPRTRVGRPTHSWKAFLGLLTTGSDRLSLFTGRITRADYFQLMAVIPYVLLASILLFVLSALGLIIPVPKAGSSLAATITSASIGAVFTLLSTSACLLYATKFIEPRWERLVGANPTSRRWAYLSANWEFALLMLVMVAVVLLLTFLPLSERNNYWTWGLVVFFMTIGSIGLAYGLIYRGMFRDYDYLNRKRDDYLIKIEEHVLKPTLNDVFEATDTQELEDTAQRYKKAREYLDGLRIENEMNGLFGEDHPEYDAAFSKFWLGELEPENSRTDWFDLPQRSRRRLNRLIRRLTRRKSTPVWPKSWWRTAPEAMEQLKAHEEEIARNHAALKDIDNQITQLDQNCVGTETKADTTRLELREQETQLCTTERDCAAKLGEHNIQRQKDEIIFSSAFLTSRFVCDYLSMKGPG
ncbi:MAG TPA: hypothetical protein VGO56_10795 [Pyrinomonadaceae bacterium]|jgi:hypothetical protein|nr:hypothetical protein [Pyrinomonadaceae bacterium]